MNHRKTKSKATTRSALAPRFAFPSRKAITPILAIILTLMMAVAIASSLFYWLSRIQNQQQGTAGQSQERLFETLATCLNIPTFDFNTLDNQSNLIVQNCGNTKLDFGDSLIADNAIISATGVSPCNFNINSSMCVGCPASLDPGAVATLTLNWTAEPNCASKILKGIKHQISFFVDRKTTTSRAFIPDDVLKCNGGLTLSNSTSLLVSTAGVTSACFNITITNPANTQDTITITNSTNSTTACRSAAIRTVTCGSDGAFNSSVGVLGKNNINLFVNHTTNAGTGSCGITLGLSSKNSCNLRAVTITAINAQA